jgi:F0F1-type ATP synthase membrane subunit c/vacuolar-type H+-ATPase subunit K
MNAAANRDTMDSMTLIAIASIVTAGLTIALGSIGPALGEGRAVATALSSLAQQPDASTTITQRPKDSGCLRRLARPPTPCARSGRKR